GWADKVRRLGVWANADYPRDAERARAFGAEGIGLCRTEHMFFEEDRLPIVRRMILAESEAERQRALDQLLPIQRQDFVGILREMAALPVVIRLIDPPLHEFLPRYDELLVDLTDLRVVEERVRPLAEQIMAEQGVRVRYKFGTMIEIPRACVVADEIARRAEFFSFGSNDLTQLIFGFSRDDAEGKFLLRYVNDKI